MYVCMHCSVLFLKRSPANSMKMGGICFFFSSMPMTMYVINNFRFIEKLLGDIVAIWISMKKYYWEDWDILYAMRVERW